MARKAFEAKNTQHEVMGTLPIETNFIDSLSFRETIESIAVAIILAMIFKTLEAEAYVIPTGSMAPSLMGQHVEIQCEECNYWFQTGTTYEGPGRSPNRNGRGLVTAVRCPMCHHDQELNRSAGPKYDPNQESFSGDRIVVSKVEYIFRDPKRWDVIVFKYPGNAKQNYIKRLVGLPNETLTLQNGDVFIRSASTQDVANDDPDLRAKLIASKPANKLASIMIPVHDTDYFSPSMRAAGLPPAWRPAEFGAADEGEVTSPWLQYNVETNGWKVNAPDEEPATYNIENAVAQGDQFHWLRFRNLLPTNFDWDAVENGGELSPMLTNSPGSLITDYYCYADSNEQTGSRRVSDNTRLGNNWVGDLIMEADLSISSSSGIIALDAVEGGVHFICKIDIATGKATLAPVISSDNVEINFKNQQGQYDAGSLEFETPLKGAGQYSIRYANCDNRIYLWVNGAEIVIPNDGAYSRRGKIKPFYSTSDPADAQPMAIGVQNATVSVGQLRVFRDLFYNDHTFGSPKDTNLAAPAGQVQELFLNPRFWNNPKVDSWFTPLHSQIDWDKSFTMNQDQFFPMGDNSPNSMDARVWNADNNVGRDMMIGKALLVYWPHSWNYPKYWPNFGRMRVIH